MNIKFMQQGGERSASS